MRRFLFFIIFLLGFGTITVHAQQDSIPADSVLYQQAIQAFQNQKFILKVESYEDRTRTVSADQSMTYVVLEDGNITISCFPEGTNAYGWAKEGTIANYRMKTNKKGDLCVSMTVRRAPAGSAKLNFTIKKGSNRCVMTCNPIKYFHRFRFTGALIPYEESDLFRPYMWLHYRKSK